MKNYVNYVIIKVGTANIGFVEKGVFPMETPKDTLTPEARFVFNLFINGWTEQEVKEAYKKGWIQKLFN